MYLEYIKKSCNLIIKRQMIPFKKKAKYLSRHFFKEDIQMANKHRNRFSVSLIISEMQIKTIPFPTTWMMRIINTDNTCWWGYGQTRTLTHCWWECRTVQSLLENSLAVPQMEKHKVNIKLTAVPLTDIYRKEMNTQVHRKHWIMPECS